MSKAWETMRTWGADGWMGLGVGRGRVRGVGRAAAAAAAAAALAAALLLLLLLLLLPLLPLLLLLPPQTFRQNRLPRRTAAPAPISLPTPARLHHAPQNDCCITPK
jgi:hypothetical protein